MGGDSLADFVKWRQPSRICELATVVFVNRPPAAPPNFAALASVLTQEQVQQLRQHQVQMPQIDISSSEIRRRVAAGQSIRFQTPRAVEAYIAANGLYEPT